MTLGRHGTSDRRLEDGRWVGEGEEPDDAEIDTQRTTDDFVDGEHVLCWWWGYWWHATVQHVARTRGTLTLRFHTSHVRVPGYKPRVVEKYP